MRSNWPLQLAGAAHGVDELGDNLPSSFRRELAQLIQLVPIFLFVGAHPDIDSNGFHEDCL
jgi:hypothetical protein